jgi:hypothetical protein
MGASVEALLGMGASRRAGSTALPAPVVRDGIVTRSDDGGVFVTPTEGGDARSPLGPCRGATRPVLVAVGTNPPTYRQQQQQLPEKTPVLIVTTARGTWVVAHEERSTT